VVPAAISIGTSTGKCYTFDSESIAISDSAGSVCRIPYAEMAQVHWMSRSADSEELVRMKRTPDVCRLIVERRGGGDVILDDLGQAVFPLLKALAWIANRNG
jgi:hypothetical protein